jgi:hypothetical protein
MDELGTRAWHEYALLVLAIASIVFAILAS